MTTPNPNQLLTVKQVCTEYGIGKTMLYDLVRSGAIKKRTLGKRATRFRRGDIDDWVNGLT